MTRITLLQNFIIIATEDKVEVFMTNAGKPKWWMEINKHGKKVFVIPRHA